MSEELTQPEVQEPTVSVEKKVKKTRQKRKPKALVSEDAKYLAKEMVGALGKKSSESLTIDDIQDMPLETAEDYFAYNDAVRAYRKRTRMKDGKYKLPFKYIPHELVQCVNVKMTRTKNRGRPISINLRCSKEWIHVKGYYKDGEETRIPFCMVNRINDLAEPKYKQVTYQDGSYSTELDYMDNKYNCQVIYK